MLFIECKNLCVLLLIVVSFVVIYTAEARPSETNYPDNSDDDRNEVITTENENKNVKSSISHETMEYRISYSKMMQAFMNQTVDPCDDFYKYACGNWNSTLQERQSQHKRNYLNDIIYMLLDIVEELLFQEENEQFVYKEELHLAKQLYNSCLSADLFPMKKSEDYLNAIRSIGGFPAVDKKSWNADNFSWINMTAHLSNYGISSLVNEKIIPQYPYPPYFRVPELGFDLIVHSDNIANTSSRGYMLNKRRMRTYLTTYGVSNEEADKVIDDVFDFWHSVLTIMDEFEEDLEKCLELDSPEFSTWNDYLAIVWNNIDFNVTEDNCPCDYFYVKLDEICNERKEAVANYLAMKFLYAMDAKLKDVKFQREYCLNNIRSSISFFIDHMYMSHHFNEQIRDELLVIINEIRKSLRVVLNEAVWLDENTRHEALLKESTITTRVGNFENAILTNRIIKEMTKIHFEPNSYELNNLNLQKHKAYVKRYLGLNKDDIPPDTKPLELYRGMQINAFYYNFDNSINIMAGILHPPAYHRHWPNSLKFGTIGYLIGHEFTHGFDSVGAFFDSEGKERYWWSNKSEDVFTDRSTCYINHYNNYTIPQINRNINGNKTLDENIADSGGLREALMAYRRYIKELYADSDNDTLLKEEQMPGLNLSPDQLFFVSFAHLWCSAYKEEHFWEELTDEHTVDRYRVLGAVTNYEEFAKVFNCPLGSNMHPKADKCRLW